MGRQKNDGRGRLGGRAKGTPNKATSTFKEWLEWLLNDNRKQIAADLKAISPYERLKMLERLLSYVMPKQSSIGIQAQIEAEYKALQMAMQNLDDTTLEKIAEKMYQLEQKNEINENTD